MEENDFKFERRLRIGFGFIIVGFIIWAMSSCASGQHIDCDAYSQQPTQQNNSTI